MGFFSETGEQSLENLGQIGIGVKHRQNGSRGDGEKGDSVAGARGHVDLFQIGRWVLTI